MPNPYEYNARFESVSPTQIIGEYKLGLFYSTNLFLRYSLMGTHPCMEEDDILQCITSYHESFHSIQDVATGFGCLVNEFMRIRDECAIEDLQQLMKNVSISIPLASQSQSPNGNDINRQQNEIVQRYTQVDKTVNGLLTGGYKEHGIGAIEILEGAAVFFSEIYRRWHIFTEYLRSPEEFANIYNFQAICERINKLPPKYNLALNYYRDHLVEHWTGASDVDICNLFLLICDHSLQVPDPETISKNLESQISETMKTQAFEKYLPGNRFVSLIKHIVIKNLFFNRVPMERFGINVILSDAHPIYPKAYKQLFDLKIKKAAELEKKFNKCQYNEDDDFNSYIDKLCGELGYESVDEICEGWIRFFEEQIQIAPLEEILKLRLEYMNLRKLHKCFLSSFPNIKKTLQSREYPTYFRTRLGTRVYCKMEDAGKTDMIHWNIVLKMFVRSITYQLLISGIKTCPFSDKTIYECEEEEPECSYALDYRDKKISKCQFGKMFKMIFGIPLSRIR